MDEKLIGIVSQAEWADLFVSDLLKRKVKAKKLNTQSHFADFHTVIIDLLYPKEMGYLLLEKLTQDYQFSETHFLVVISNRQQMKRLRGLAFGVDGYISPLISVDSLLEKIKLLDSKVESVENVEFEGLSIPISYNSLLSHISESGAILKSKVSHPNGTQTLIEGSLLRDFGISDEIVAKVSKTNPIIKRSFNQEVDFVDLTTQEREKLRNSIRGWSVSP